jgi:HEAT repeat protein
VGDHRAVEPLAAALRDEKRELTASSRAFAAVALGLLGDKAEVPWNARISADFNYLAFVETLLDLIWEV